MSLERAQYETLSCINPSMDVQHPPFTNLRWRRPNDGLLFRRSVGKHEGNVSLLSYLKGEGIDIKKDSVKLWAYEHELFPRGRIYYNEGAENSIKGL